MKKLIDKPGALAFLLIAVYLAGMVIGMVAIILYPVYHRQKNGLYHRAEIIAAEYLEGVDETIKYVKSPTLQILIYGADERCLQSVVSSRAGEDAGDNGALHAYLSPYLPAALSGQDVFAMAPSYERPKKLSHFCLIAGVPIREGETVVGAVFLVRFLENLQEAYLGYAVCFSVSYWVAAYFGITFSRKKKKLKEMEQTYIANVTHALKTPIASIKAITETLSDVADLDPDKRICYYGMILREVNLQSHMVQEILELSRLQSRGVEFAKESVFADAAFQEVLEKFSVLCQCAQISFFVSESMAHLPPLCTNRRYIGQVLEVLLENAVKYVSIGDTIWFDAELGKDRVVFCVRDNGRGILKEDLPHVFERFYTSARAANAGSGLGLAIAKEIVDNLKEKIWVESEPGQGTAFYFTVHINMACTRPGTKERPSARRWTGKIEKSKKES